MHLDGLVGALGAWLPNNDHLLVLLRVSSGYISLMRRLIVSETIAWSRDLYVEHVSGTRQYRVSDAGALHPEAPAARVASVSDGCNDEAGE